MSPLRPAVFLDRDGTLIEDAHYLADPDGVVLIDGAVDALARLRAAGLALVVVTNQSGIARGLISLDEYQAVAARVNTLLERAGAPVDLTCFCPHHPEVTGPCSCRKPALGMHRAAARALGLDLARSYFVGDKWADVEAGRRAGGHAILVRTGYGRRTEAREELPREVAVVDSVREAADLILESHRGARVDPSRTAE